MEVHHPKQQPSFRPIKPEAFKPARRRLSNKGLLSLSVAAALIFVGLTILSLSYAGKSDENGDLVISKTDSGRNIGVKTSEALRTALSSAQAGDTILLEDGVYSGNFTANTSGTAAKPIRLVGSRKAIITSSSKTSKVALSIGQTGRAPASYWQLMGFSVTNSGSGIVFTNVTKSSIESVSLRNIGGTAIRIADKSASNSVISNAIDATGQSNQLQGYGIEIGTSETAIKATKKSGVDATKQTTISKNTIIRTKASAIIVNSGSEGGTISNNSLDGKSICTNPKQECPSISIVDLVGSGWKITDNTIENIIIAVNGDNFKSQGIYTHPSKSDKKTNNFRGNIFKNITGYGIYADSPTAVSQTTVTCSSATNTTMRGYSNVTCVKQ